MKKSSTSQTDPAGIVAVPFFESHGVPLFQSMPGTHPRDALDSAAMLLSTAHAMTVMSAEDEEGHCAYAASALIEMARSLVEGVRRSGGVTEGA